MVSTQIEEKVAVVLDPGKHAAYGLGSKLRRCAGKSPDLDTERPKVGGREGRKVETRVRCGIIYR